MAITQASFGVHHGQEVLAYTLTNSNNCTARLITFGARLVEMHVPDKHGKVADIVLGFDTLAPYTTSDTYFGATCGRYANRIKNGQFYLDDQPVQVACNEGQNHLHGGQQGLDKQVWDATVNQSENSVTFSHVSKHGDAGFPGQLLLETKYTLTDDNRLLITLQGNTDSTTVLNLVNHAYWNVAGHDSGSVMAQMLSVDADFYTPVDDQLLATGEVLSVSGTAFDFRVAKPIGQGMQSAENSGSTLQTDHIQQGDYDHNWVLRGSGPGLHPVATVWDPLSGRGLTVRSTEPGVQIYTGGKLSTAVIGKNNTPYPPYAGLTFETQKFPGTPNFSHFPTARLEPGETYCHEMEIQFLAR